METIFSIIAILSLLAFVVGMINPATVKCSSRGKVALIFLGIFFISGIIGASLQSDTDKLSAHQAETEQDEPEQAKEEPNEIPTLEAGMVYTMKYDNSTVEIMFDKIIAKPLRNDKINLVFNLTIKNNSDETFFVSFCDWKLLDSDNIEVEESGIYDSMFDDFAPGTFFFTTVDPHVGKRDKVGYCVSKHTYYLSIKGKIIAKLPLEEKVK